jgi:hypothetical protein
MFSLTVGSFFNLKSLTLNLYTNSNKNPNGHIQPQNTLPNNKVRATITINLTINCPIVPLKINFSINPKKHKQKLVRKTK